MQITGREPAHWHDDAGRHRLRDPRETGMPKTHWSKDTKAFAAHLEAHEHERAHPRKRAGDLPLVASLIDLIEARDRERHTMAELVDAIRQAAAEGRTEEEIQTLVASRA